MTDGTEWIDQARRVLDTLRSGIADGAERSADGTHAADCRWCPVCQLAAVARGERPELTAALADVLTATATALRAFAAEGTPPSGDESDLAEPDVDQPGD